MRALDARPPRPARRLRQPWLRLGVVLALAAAPTSAGAAEPPPAAPAAAPEEFAADDWGDIDAVEGAVETGDAVVVDHGVIGTVGRLHPALVHMPIGWLLMVVILDLLVVVGRGKGLERAGTVALTLTALSFIPAIATGLMRSDTYEAPPDVLELIATHELLMWVTAALVVAALALRLTRRTPLTGGPRAIYLALMLAAAGTVAWGGHIGGKVVFGADFLPF